MAEGLHHNSAFAKIHPVRNSQPISTIIEKHKDSKKNRDIDNLLTFIIFVSFQDAKLKQLVEKYNERFDIIAKHFPDRSDIQCQQRWQKVVNPELVKGPWTKEVCYQRRAISFNSRFSLWKLRLFSIILSITLASALFFKSTLFNLWMVSFVCCRKTTWYWS